MHNIEEQGIRWIGLDNAGSSVAPLLNQRGTATHN
jgi:hypothetical protein